MAHARAGQAKNVFNNRNAQISVARASTVIIKIPAKFILNLEEVVKKLWPENEKSQIEIIAIVCNFGSFFYYKNLISIDNVSRFAIVYYTHKSHKEDFMKKY